MTPFEFTPRFMAELGAPKELFADVIENLTRITEHTHIGLNPTSYAAGAIMIALQDRGLASAERDGKARARWSFYETELRNAREKLQKLTADGRPEGDPEVMKLKRHIDFYARRALSTRITPQSKLYYSQSMVSRTAGVSEVTVRNSRDEISYILVNGRPMSRRAVA